MIAVAVQPSERAAAQEFFELCKTAWEFFDPEKQYEILISTSELPELAAASVTIVYNAQSRAYGPSGGVPISKPKLGRAVLHGKARLPIYRSLATFPESDFGLVRDEETKESALFASRDDHRTIISVGYNLFSEVQHLLTVGQPIENARIPTVELHIALLRDLVTRAGIQLVEIPPVPAGHRFIACLTHDIDHPLLRKHCFDHTMLGFLFRAAIMSPLNVCRGRLSLAGMLQNWAAVIRLPFLHLGLAVDPWSEFDRYLKLEDGLGSTYFFIPEQDNPGRKRDGSVAAKRACRYGLADVAPQLRKIHSAGQEIALHGLDAWRDADCAEHEKGQLSKATGAHVAGTRMHWLYFDEQSHTTLEKAGFTYDSTVGYNETVGYRTGTAQAYRPLGSELLLELPLHIMDTALFYPSYLNLAEAEAFQVIEDMLDQVELFGGALTINWHDRSIFAERLWGGFYIKFVDEMKRRQAWFPTMTQAVAWFRKRRAVPVEAIRQVGEPLVEKGRLDELDSLPGLTLRIHHPCPRSSNEPLATGAPARFSDVPFDHPVDTELKV